MIRGLTTTADWWTHCSPRASGLSAPFITGICPKRWKIGVDGPTATFLAISPTTRELWRNVLVIALQSGLRSICLGRFPISDMELAHFRLGGQVIQSF